MASKLEIEFELKTPAEKLWKNLKEFVIIFPKAVPNIYEKIDVIEGDGRSAGSVLTATLKPSEMNPVVLPTKERIEMVDEENKILGYSILEGEIMKIFKSFKAIICVSSNKHDGTLIKYSAELVWVNAEQVIDLQFLKDIFAKLFHGLDEYLLKE